MKLIFSRQIFVRSSNNNFHQNPSVGAELFHSDGQTKGQTDMTKLAVGFRNFTNAPKKESLQDNCF